MRYANMVKRNFGGRTVQLVTSYRRLDELGAKLENFSYRVLKEDCLDLPDKVFTKRIVERTKEQKEIDVPDTVPTLDSVDLPPPPLFLNEATCLLELLSKTPLTPSPSSPSVRSTAESKLIEVPLTVPTIAFAPSYL